MTAEILLPPGFSPERRLTLGYLFEELLGFGTVFRDSPEGSPYRVRVGAVEFAWPDLFFPAVPGGGTYIRESSLPKAVSYLPVEGLPESKLPVFYGDAHFSQSDGSVSFAFDLPAMIFFGISRWEEALPGPRDTHGRYPAHRSFASRTGILGRPWIDEHAEFLASILRRLGVPVERPDRYRIIPTHDVDKASGYEWKTIAGDFVKLRRPGAAIRKTFHNVFRRTNPYDSFDFLMDLSDTAGLISRFYFMAEGRSKHDGQYLLSNPYIRSTIKKIRTRGHSIGLHPSYRSFNDGKLWKQELEKLESVAEMRILECRQHFLMYEPMTTWAIQDSSGIRIDSTMGYAAEPGFRSGTGSEHPCFDLGRRRVLNVRERPFVVMDGTLSEYLNLGPDRGYDILMKLKELCRGLRIPFTLLFHNASFDSIEWPGWKEAYTGVLASGRSRI